MKRNIICSRKSIVIRTIWVFNFLMIFGISQNKAFGQNENWIAPVSANKIINPYAGNEKATIAGQEVYKLYCAICHGKKGKGDGIAGMALSPRPSNFTKDAIQKQSDGALYWKLTEGKAPMAAYKETLTEEQRWQLVNYIRAMGL